jgi:hypothetical protein
VEHSGPWAPVRRWWAANPPMVVATAVATAVVFLRARTGRRAVRDAGT